MSKILVQIGVIAGAIAANSYVCEKAAQAGIDGKIKPKTADRIMTASSITALAVVLTSGTIAKKVIAKVVSKTTEVVVDSVI